MTKNRKILIIAIILLAIISVIFVRAFARFGEFSRLNPRFDGSCEQDQSHIPGIEDIAQLNDKNQPNTPLLVLSSYNREKARNDKAINGALFVFDVIKNQAVQIQNPNKKFHPIGISVLNQDNPLIMAVNNAENQSYIEVFKLNQNGVFAHINSILVPEAHRLNDVIAISENSFFATNEGKYPPNSIMNFVTNLLDIDKSGEIIFFDGAQFKKTPTDSAFANSIALSNDQSKLYLTSTLERNLQIYGKSQDNVLKLVDNVFLGTGVDNIFVDNEDAVFIAAHPRLFTLMRKMWFGGKNAPAQLIVVEPNQKGKGGNIDQVYLADGNEKFGQVAIGAKIGENLIMGSIYSDGLMQCKLPKVWHQSKTHPAQKLIDVERDAKIKAQSKH
jgi:arylesterase / paraoxonase